MTVHGHGASESSARTRTTPTNKDILVLGSSSKSHSGRGLIKGRTSSLGAVNKTVRGTHRAVRADDLDVQSREIKVDGGHLSTNVITHFTISRSRAGTIRTHGRVVRIVVGSSELVELPSANDGPRATVHTARVTESVTSASGRIAL
jgi:hypothetical protein